MPDWLAVIILGILEGLTEFLPVSSTGHLLLAERLGWLPHQSEVFNVVIQCGAVLAVLLVFSRRARELTRDWREPPTRAYLSKLLTAFGLTCIGGLLLKKMNFTLEESAVAPVLWATLIGGILILLIEYWLKGKPTSSNIAWPVALAVAGGQLLAMAFPGTSRSGATILIAMAMGASRPAATEFSFLLGIPTLLSAGAYQIITALQEMETSQEHWTLILVGTAAATATAFVVVKWLLRYVQSHTFNPFGWYRIALAMVIFAFLLR